eukprot:9023985-Lingulodinium_polyedra.AAC.1
MNVQEAAVKSGLMTERACDAFRLLDARLQHRTAEAMKTAAPQLLWIGAFNPSTGNGTRRQVKLAELLTELCRIQHSGGRCFVIEGSPKSYLWDLAPVARLRRDLNLRPETVR